MSTPHKHDALLNERGSPAGWVPSALTVSVTAGAIALVWIRRDQLAGLGLPDIATAIAGLSSTLALIWLVYGYRMQATELRLQREQLAAQREELRLQRLEFEKMVAAQTTQSAETAKLAASQQQMAETSAQTLRATIDSQRRGSEPVINCTGQLTPNGRLEVEIRNIGATAVDLTLWSHDGDWQCLDSVQFWPLFAPDLPVFLRFERKEGAYRKLRIGHSLHQKNLWASCGSGSLPST